MVIMHKRYLSVVEAIAGLQQTGVPLVAAQKGVLDSANVNDDPGLYYFVPLLAQRFHLPADAAIDVFLGGMLGLAVLLGLLGCWLFLRTWPGRLAALVQVALVGGVALVTGDVYVAPVAAVVGGVPLFLYFVARGRADVPFGLFLFAVGVGTAIAQTVRTHAGTPVWLLIVTWLVLGFRAPRGRKLALVGSLVCGIVAWQAFFGTRIDRRDAYLVRHQPGYVLQHRDHIVWSSIYEGLGFLSNNHGLVWNDEAAGANIDRIAPGLRFTSPEYEQVVRGEVLRIAREHPYFTARTLFAKLGVMGMYLLFSAHLGLLAAMLSARSLVRDASFWPAMALAGVPGVLVMPWHGYVSGFLALSALYAVVSIDRAVAAGLPAALGRLRALAGLPQARP
jgi:hypothetical protein